MLKAPLSLIQLKEGCKKTIFGERERGMENMLVNFADNFSPVECHFGEFLSRRGKCIPMGGAISHEFSTQFSPFLPDSDCH